MHSGGTTPFDQPIKNGRMQVKPFFMEKKMLILREEYETIFAAIPEYGIEIHQKFPLSEDTLVLLSKAQAKKLLAALPALIEQLKE